MRCVFKCDKTWFQSLHGPASLHQAVLFPLIGFLDRLSPCGCEMAAAATGLKSSQHYREKTATDRGMETHVTHFVMMSIMHVYSDVIIVSCLFCLFSFKAVIGLSPVDTMTSIDCHIRPQQSYLAYLGGLNQYSWPYY